MKAAVYERYGSPDVLELRDVPQPAIGDDSVLVRVRAAAVNPLDWHSLRGEPFVVRAMQGLRAPKNKTLGNDWAGTVEAVGTNVTGFQPGDDVIGMQQGGFAEYVSAPATRLVAKPAEVTFEAAAAAPVAALTALQGLRDKGRLQAGHKVLINGASGGVGTYAVQIAKLLDAEVTGVCSTKNLELVTSLGADRVVDYNKEDFAAGAERYDVFLDTVGNRSLSECKRLLRPGGAYVAIAGSPTRMIWLMLGRRRTMLAMITSSKREDLVTVVEWLQSGRIQSVIDRRFSLDETAEALRYQGEGHARGKVIIMV